MNENAQAAILVEIHNILYSIPNLKQTLISLKEGRILDSVDIRNDYDFTIASPLSNYYTNGKYITYEIPWRVNSISKLNKYISDKGGDTYKIFGSFGPYKHINAYILIKNGVNSLANASTYKASKGYIKITFSGGGKRRNKRTKKARKHRNRTRKHRF